MKEIEEYKLPTFASRKIFPISNVNLIHGGHTVEPCFDKTSWLDHSGSDEEDEFMSMVPSQAPGDDPKTTAPLEETETAEQVHDVKCVHSLSDNEKNDC